MAGAMMVAAPCLPACSSSFLGDTLMLRCSTTTTITTSRSASSTFVRRGLCVEAAKHANKKCTAHHNKTRPKKKRPSDIKKGAKDYGPWPEPPPVWEVDLEGRPAAVPVTTTSSSSA